MEKFICKICNLSFKSKFSLERHENKKNKCNLVTDYKCNNCNKCFKEKRSLIAHKEKNKCKIISIPKTSKEKNEIALLDILESKMDMIKKIKLIKIINNSLIDENILEILNNDLPQHTKIILLNSHSKTTINNTTNNTINYNINNFGSENIDYIKDKHLLTLLNQVSGRNKLGGEHVFLRLSNEIYLNEKHPENQTIKIDNLNNKFCKIKENNKWITTNKNDALQKIFTRICIIVSSCLEDNQDAISEQQINIINDYINKEFTDKYIAETVKKLALNIYNFYNSTII